MADLSAELEKRGYRGRMVNIRRLRDLENEIQARYDQRLISEDIYQILRAALAFRIPDDMREAHSLIIVALPDPMFEVVFHQGGVSRTVDIPPTYVYFHEVNRRARKALEDILGTQQYAFALARVPAKLLAVRSGLASYGKNNVSYVPGMGSYHRLVAFYSDYLCHQDNWGKPSMMEACETCSACLKSCPTKAITADRFLIRAERCLTFVNENEGPFPEWVDPSWHHCLVGCLLCQTVCPQNRGMLKTVRAREEFSESETALLLKGGPARELPKAVSEKLDHLGLLDYHEVLPRNLGVLLSGETQA